MAASHRAASDCSDPDRIFGQELNGNVGLLLDDRLRREITFRDFRRSRLLDPVVEIQRLEPDHAKIVQQSSQSVCLHTRNVFSFLVSLIAVAAYWRADASSAAEAKYPNIKIGNYLVTAPYGIAFIIDYEKRFVMDPVWDHPRGSRYRDNDPSLVPPGIAAADFSSFGAQFPRGKAVQSGSGVPDSRIRLRGSVV